MHDQNHDNLSDIRPRSFGQWCAYLLALAIVGTIEFIEAVPYHLRFYAWCIWHFTGGQIKLHFSLWRLRLEQAIRRDNPYYRKLDH